MADPRDKAAGKLAPVLGEGCLARYDLEALSEAEGTEFPGAAELWQQLNPPADGSVPAAAEPAGRRRPARRRTDRNSR